MCRHISFTKSLSFYSRFSKNVMWYKTTTKHPSFLALQIYDTCVKVSYSLKNIRNFTFGPYFKDNTRQPLEIYLYINSDTCHMSNNEIMMIMRVIT